MKIETNVVQLPRTKKPLPIASVEGEQALLGTIFLDNRVLDEMPFLQSKHFYWEIHQRIFDVTAAIIRSGDIALVEAVEKRFPADTTGLDGMKLLQYLNHLFNEGTLVINAVQYGKMVYELAQKRSLLKLCLDLADQTNDPEVDLTISQRIAEFDRRLDEIRAGAVDDNNRRLLQSSKTFVQDFIPPDYLVDGLLQRKFCYSLTGKTGAGKTAIALLVAASVALGRSIGSNIETAKGRVLYLAGENPVDIQMRWIAMAQQHDFDVDTIDIHFLPGVFKISEIYNRVAAEVETLGGVSLVIIDTTAAFFEGDDENDNVQAGKYARIQRSMVELPGGPTVVALCHPVKNAGDENLLPRGGGAYLNEVDGNLTAKSSDLKVEVHWQGKYRGVDFAPISFQLRTVTHERLIDSKGRLGKTVIAKHLSEAAEKEITAASRTDEDELLALIQKNPKASLSEYARLLHWHMASGEPNKMRAMRTANELKREKLIEETRSGLQLTDKGRKEVQG